jgi:FkbM family methyltransferase
VPTPEAFYLIRPINGAMNSGQPVLAVAKTMLDDSPSNSETLLPHKARSFTALPSPAQARPLLADIATAPCPFAPARADAPLALYGAGNLGQLARDFLKAVGQDLVTAIDRNAHQLACEPGWAGVPLFQPDEVTETAKCGTRLAVSVVTTPYVPLERSLTELGFTDIVPFFDLAESFRHVHPLSNGWFARPLTPDDEEKTSEVLARWDDDASRAQHLQFLAWRRLREEWTFEAAPVPDCERFFVPEVTSILRQDEILLDAGAHHGTVMDAFARHTKNAFRQIIAVEPDPANRAKLAGRLQADPRITIYDCALAETEGDALFHDGLGYASQLSDTGQMRITTRPLDALDLSPTFVKLHLEGAELAALKGARQTLLSNRPIIVTTVYHNADGIWRTPLWLMETLPDYRFIFRAHSWCGNGAVVYAIPKSGRMPAA